MSLFRVNGVSARLPDARQQAAEARRLASITKRHLAPADPFDPYTSPDRQVVAIANAILPVLPYRVRGSATFTEAEFDDVKRRYGGSVNVSVKRHPDSVHELKLASLATPQSKPTM